MSRILRYTFLILALTFILLPGPPAGASFSAVCYITSSALPPIRVQADTDGGATFYVETPNGDARFLQIRPAGGHWEVLSMTSLPSGTALELDSNGYPLVHQD
jgi:hypothetical protein